MLLASTGPAAGGAAHACVQPLPAIAQDVDAFRSAPPTETDVCDRDWASCEAGAAERRLLLGSATTRGCQMGTCKKRPQRDRGPLPTQVPSRCPILFCRRTASAQGSSRRPCLRDKRAVGGCRLPPRTRPRIGNRFGNVRRYRQQEHPNNGFRQVSAGVHRPARTDWCGLFRDPPLRPNRAPARQAARAESWYFGEPEAEERVICGATSNVAMQPPDPRRRCDVGAEPPAGAHAVRGPIDGTVVEGQVDSGEPAHQRTLSGTGTTTSHRSASASSSDHGRPERRPGAPVATPIGEADGRLRVPMESGKGSCDWLVRR